MPRRLRDESPRRASLNVEVFALRPAGAAPLGPAPAIVCGAGLIGGGPGSGGPRPARCRSSSNRTTPATMWRTVTTSRGRCAHSARTRAGHRPSAPVSETPTRIPATPDHGKLALLEGVVVRLQGAGEKGAALPYRQRRGPANGVIRRRGAADVAKLHYFVVRIWGADCLIRVRSHFPRASACS